MLCLHVCYDFFNVIFFQYYHFQFKKLNLDIEDIYNIYSVKKKGSYENVYIPTSFLEYFQYNWLRNIKIVSLYYLYVVQKVGTATASIFRTGAKIS